MFELCILIKDVFYMDNRAEPVVYFIVPCYNEEEIIKSTTETLLARLRMLVDNAVISKESRLIFVDDGSTDKTVDYVEELGIEYNNVGYIFLSRNEGHQNALMCGLMACKDFCDVTVSIDCDLQDDIDVIADMLIEYKNGAEIVYGVRDDRKSDSFLKRLTAEGFYVLQTVLGVEMVFNSADYRLVSSKALQALSEYKEVNLYLRGLMPKLGFKTAQVSYNRHARQAGVSKYTLAKMLKLATDGIVSFTTRPLHLIWLFAILWCISATVVGMLGVIHRSFELSLLSVICSGFGITNVALGLLALYVGSILTEVKHRPLYHIKEQHGIEGVQKDAE